MFYWKIILSVAVILRSRNQITVFNSLSIYFHYNQWKSKWINLIKILLRVAFFSFLFHRSTYKILFYRVKILWKSGLNPDKWWSHGEIINTPRFSHDKKKVFHTGTGSIKDSKGRIRRSIKRKDHEWHVSSIYVQKRQQVGQWHTPRQKSTEVKCSKTIVLEVILKLL